MTVSSNFTVNKHASHWHCAEILLITRTLVQGIKQFSGLTKFPDFLPAATKLGQGNVFTGVCDSVNGGGCASVGYHPPRGRPPKENPPKKQTPTRQSPLRRIPPPQEADPPRRRTPPTPRSRRSMSGRYAYYWNAFLFSICFHFSSIFLLFVFF